MNSRILSSAAVLVSLASCAQKAPVGAHTASNATTHAATDHQAVLDALRTGKEASFQVHRLNFSHDDAWAYADVTPLDKARKPIAEGGPHVLHRAAKGWKDLDLSKVPADPNDPLGAEDNSPGWVKNVQNTYPGVPREIFPRASH
jgi:hypothetical protein